MEGTATVQESSSDRPQSVRQSVLKCCYLSTGGLFHGEDNDSTGVVIRLTSVRQSVLKCCYLSTGGLFHGGDSDSTGVIIRPTSVSQTVSVEVLLSFHRGLFHGGDSDSTGIIAACCYGAAKGFQGVPEGNHKVNKPDVLSESY